MSCTYLIGYNQNFDASTQSDKDWQWQTYTESSAANTYYENLYSAHFAKKKIAGCVLMKLEFGVDTGAITSAIMQKAMHKLTTTIHYNKKEGMNKAESKIVWQTMNSPAQFGMAVPIEAPDAAPSSASEFPSSLLETAYHDYFS